MDYEALYENCVLSIEADAARCKETGKRIVLGYTSDLDVVLDWDADVFTRIAAEYLVEEPRYAPGDQIDSMQAFARIFTHFLASGQGGEIDITAQSVCDALEARFATSYALGGTCAQGAAALGAVGVPVLARISDRSREVCELLDAYGVTLFSNGRALPAALSASCEPPVRHLVLQYPKGARVSFRGREYAAPASNRVIMDYDVIHKYVPIERDFLKHCEHNAKDIYAYGISGFNGILDPSVMTERLCLLLPHYKVIKARNPAAVIYLEGACYLNPDVKDLAFEWLAHAIDILGMNEEELALHAARLDVAVDIGAMPSIVHGLTRLLARYPAQGIVMHTQDYSMYFGRSMPGVDFAKGLTAGNLMSGTRARIGRYGTREDLRETLAQPLSEKGLRMAADLARTDTGGYFAVAVPSRYMERPKYTIGLGDTFTAGMLTAFIQ